MLRTKRLARERILPSSVLVTVAAGAASLAAACASPNHNVKGTFGRHVSTDPISNSGSGARKADAVKAIRLAYGLTTMAFELSYGKHAVWEGVNDLRTVPLARTKFLFEVVEAALGKGSPDRAGELSALLPEGSSYGGISRADLVQLVANGGLEQALRDGIGTDKSLAVLDAITNICEDQWHKGRRLFEETPNNFTLPQWRAVYARLKGYREQLIPLEEARRREEEEHKLQTQAGKSS